ncbi:TolA-binding protein [Bradyrhizobium japonicum]
MKKRICVGMAVLMAGSAIVRPAYAFVDPVTASMTIGLVSQGLALGAKPDPQAKEISAILEHVRSMGERLTKIEDGIVDTQEMIAALPKQWREDLKSLVDTLRKEDMRAISQVLKEFASGLSSLERGDSNQRLRFQNRLEQAIVHFKEKSRALEQRSGAVAAYMIAAMVQEIAIERHLKVPRQTILDILRFYDGYFARMQDKTVSGSLAQVRAQFETDRASDRETLAELLSKKKGSPLSGEYPFYAVTKTNPVPREVEPSRPERCPGGAGSRRLVFEAPPCQEARPAKVVIEDIPSMTFRHAWQIAFKHYEDHPELGVLEVGEVTREDAGAPSPERARDVSIVDKRYEADRSKVAKLVKVINTRDQALALIQEQETAVAMARTLIANWDSGQAEALASRVDALQVGDISAMKAEIEDVRGSMQVDENRTQMIESRRQALEPVRQAEERLQEAIKEAKADKWRRDIMHGLAIAQFGIQTYRVVEMYLPKEKTETTPKSEEAKTQPKPKPASVKPARKQIVADSRIGSPRDGRTTVRKFYDAAITGLKYAEAMPAQRWARLPERPTRSEAEIDLALANLERADQAAVVLKNQKPGAEFPTETELFRQGADLVKDGSYRKAIALALIPSSTVGPDRDDTAESFRHRNEIRGQLLNLKADFAAKRAAQARENRKRDVQQ